MTDEHLAQVEKEINKLFGEGVLVSGVEASKHIPHVIPFSPALDVGLGGGIPEGSWVIVCGKAKVGKTSSLLQFAANCQKPEHGSRLVVYGDVEGRLKHMNLTGIEGLNMDQMKIIHSTKDKILSAQDFLTIFEKFLLTMDNIVLIIDSFPMLCHEKELTDGVGTSTRGGQGVLLSGFCRQMSGVVPVKNHIVCGTTHIMSNTSGFGSPFAEKGGTAITYQVDVKIKCKKTEEWLEDKKRVGQIVTWVTECTALGMPPGVEIQSYLRYGHGLDAAKEIIMIGTDLDLITQSGSWYICDFLKNHLKEIGVAQWNEETLKPYRAQGETKLYQLMKSNPKWMPMLMKDIQQIMGG